MAEAGQAPDQWQRQVLESVAPRILMCCSRQAGKSAVAAAVALRTALLEPPALVLLLSPTLRQSGELFRDKLVRLYDALGRPVPAVQESALQMTLANKSRIIALPGADDAGIRGYSGVDLLIVDEASRVSDQLIASARPMLAVSRGRLLALSTPWGRRGWFHAEWAEGQGWERFTVKAAQVPRIDAAFLERERVAMGDIFWRQEYGCEFLETTESLFRQEDIDALINPRIEPFVFERPV
jgi:hypothetical protein